MTTEWLKNVVPGVLVLLSIGCGSSSQSNPMPTPTPGVTCIPANNFETAYLLTGENGGTVHTFSVDSCTGGFSSNIPPVTASPNQFGSEDVVVDPLGRFLYVANLVSNVSGPSAIS